MIKETYKKNSFDYQQEINKLLVNNLNLINEFPQLNTYFYSYKFINTITKSELNTHFFICQTFS